MARIFAYIEHRNGTADDSASELAAAARKIDAGRFPYRHCDRLGRRSGCGLPTALCASYGQVWKIAKEALAYPNAELVRKALVSVLPQDSIVLVPHTHFGIDLGPGLSIKLNSAFVSDVVAIEGVEGAYLKVVRQEFGGQVSAHVRCDISSGAVINDPPRRIQAGGKCSRRRAGRSTSRRRSALLRRGRRYLETIVAEPSDVDITKHQVLVSIGRGIQEKDNVPIAEELADALGAAVSCSRPVVDAKWLPKSRQVGSSGQTVRPKVYLACGISGSFQHLAGLKGNPFIVAINKNPKAPIFQVANVGIVDDILEFLPELTERITNPQITPIAQKKIKAA